MVTSIDNDVQFVTASWFFFHELGLTDKMNIEQPLYFQFSSKDMVWGRRVLLEHGFLVSTMSSIRKRIRIFLQNRTMTFGLSDHGCSQYRQFLNCYMFGTFYSKAHFFTVSDEDVRAYSL